MLSKQARRAAACIAASLLVALAHSGHAHGQEGEDEAPSGAAGPYASAEGAFQAVFVDSGLGRRAYRENIEYAAALYQLADGNWYSTRVRAGTRDASSIPYMWVPPAALRIVGAHTHGQPRLAEDPSRLYGTDFSPADRRNAEHNFRITRGRIGGQLLLSSELKILRLSFAARPSGAAPAPQDEAPPACRMDVLGQVDAETGPLAASRY